jgi:hypothetical protein
MSENDNQIEFVLDEPANVEKTPTEPVVEVVAEGEVQKKEEPNVQEALETLQKKLKKAEKLREKAEQEAYEASRRAQQATTEVESNHITLVSTAIDTVKRDQEILKANLRDSLSIGDYDRAAQINDAMSMNSAKLLQLEQGFTEMKSRPRQEEPVRHSDPIDDLASRVTPLSAKWLKQNRDHLDDPRAIRMMGRAHEDAVDMGIRPESDEYFRFVEDRLGIGREQPRQQQRQEQSYESDSPFSEAASSSSRRQSPPAAPVSRSGSAPGTRPNVVRLTPAEVEAAKISGITPQEYYMNKVKEQNRAQ